MSPTLASGAKSRVTVTADGRIRKVYEGPEDADGRYTREVGFYQHYGASPLIPDLLECSPAETAIVIGRAPGVPCSTLDPSPDLRRHLSRDYAEKVMALIESGGDVAVVKMSHFGGQGAADFRRGTLALLDRYQAVSRRCGQILEQITASVRDAPVTEELLIKLDWNASNVFVDDCAINRFIDFEQAFVGTREMLAGILLHNPFWYARSVFQVLHRRSVFPYPTAALETWIRFAFGAVLADSVARSGRRWSEARLESAYRRHVTERCVELTGRVPA